MSPAAHWSPDDYYRASRQARAAWEATQPQLTMEVDDVDEHTRHANEVLASVFGKFAGKPKRARAKPHRCFDCGKVTKHVRCPDCSARRAAK